MRHCRVTFKIVTRPIDQSDCWKLTWGIINLYTTYILYLISVFSFIVLTPRFIQWLIILKDWYIQYMFYECVLEINFSDHGHYWILYVNHNIHIISLCAVTVVYVHVSCVTNECSILRSIVRHPVFVSVPCMYRLVCMQIFMSENHDVRLMFSLLITASLIPTNHVTFEARLVLFQARKYGHGKSCHFTSRVAGWLFLAIPLSLYYADIRQYRWRLNVLYG